MEPPRNGVSRTVLETSSRHGAPQRLHALPTSAAWWSTVVRNRAGPVRMLGRESTPAWSLWRTWLTPLTTATVAHHTHTDDGPRIATREVPWPQCRQRSASEPLVSGLLYARLCAIRPSSETVGSRRRACGNPSQESAPICVQTFPSHGGATRMRAHRVAVVQVRCRGCLLPHPRCPSHIHRHQMRSTSSCVHTSPWVPGSETCTPLDDRVEYTSAQSIFAHACSSREASKAPRHARAPRPPERPECLSYSNWYTNRPCGACGRKSRCHRPFFGHGVRQIAMEYAAIEVLFCRAMPHTGHKRLPQCPIIGPCRTGSVYICVVYLWFALRSFRHGQPLPLHPRVEHP